MCVACVLHVAFILQQNKNKYEKEVFGPILLEVQFSNAQHIKYSPDPIMPQPSCRSHHAAAIMAQAIMGHPSRPKPFCWPNSHGTTHHGPTHRWPAATNSQDLEWSGERTNKKCTNSTEESERWIVPRPYREFEPKQVWPNLEMVQLISSCKTKAV